MAMEFRKKVLEFIEKYHMLCAGDRLVVGISGGPDSVCLFDVLLDLAARYGLTLFGVHVNHGIRGAEADRDAEFVRELCDSRGVELTEVRRDVPSLAAQSGESLEEAGRRVRYDAFADTARKKNCNKIVLAHHKNDNAETILFHLFRGSGPCGLTGIAPVRDNVIRPLLAVTRTEIEEYIIENRLSFCVDSTNADVRYTRNCIRGELIPLAEKKINSRAVEHIDQAGRELAALQELVMELTEDAWERCVQLNGGNYCISVSAFAEEKQVIRGELIRKLLREAGNGLKDITAEHIRAVCALASKDTGKMVSLPGGILLRKDYENIILERAEESAAEQSICMQVSIPGRLFLPDSDKILEFSLKSGKIGEAIPKTSCIKWFDYDKIKNMIFLRTRQPGDYLEINAAGDRKTLNRYFIDEKIPSKERDSRLLLASDHHILWIIDGRISEYFKVSDATHTILEVKLSGGTKDGEKNQCVDFRGGSGRQD
ncbi:tRNA lysidine(34) synthetase TilS [Anaerolentibacter hominis]|uniref:tRNA lysidine(34) synthetase TilS n=1 Tax=Anaerolentibacter hominis TaxID=3079009 RepID=UPI0031B7FCE7